MLPPYTPSVWERIPIKIAQRQLSQHPFEPSSLLTMAEDPLERLFRKSTTECCDVASA